MRQFYRWLRREKRLVVDPSADLVYPQVGFKLPRVLTVGNAEKLMWAPDFTKFIGVRDAAILSLLMGCGLRVSDVVRLNDSNLISTEYKGTTRLVVRTLGKGNKERLIPVPREAELVLRLYLEHDELAGIDRTLADGDCVLFVSTGNRSVQEHEYPGEHRRLSSKAIWRLIQGYGHKGGIPGEQLHPHALRHLFGTELAENDVDLLIRQELMGHADPKTTKVYTSLALRKKVDELDRANPMAAMRTPVSALLEKLQGR